MSFFSKSLLPRGQFIGQTVFKKVKLTGSKLDSDTPVTPTARLRPLFALVALGNVADEGVLAGCCCCGFGLVLLGAPGGFKLDFDWGWQTEGCIGPRLKISLAIGSMVVWDVGGCRFGAVGGDEVPDNRGLERWQRRLGPPADEGMALAKTSIAMTRIIGRVAVGCILNDCILNLAYATAGE